MIEATTALHRIAIVGASGYTGEELLNLLLRHPRCEVTAATSRQYAGRTIAEIFRRFSHLPSARGVQFTEPDLDTLAEKADCVFLALPHGVAAEFAVPLVKKGLPVIDLSADFRIRDAQVYEDFYQKPHPAPDLLAAAVYGLPEIHRAEIARAKLIASPGCYPTSILLPCIPLLRSNLIQPDSIIADSLSGVSGAGRKPQIDYLFVECNESVRPYGIPKHRHLAEIEQELGAAAGTAVTAQFTPHLVPTNRGILSTLYLQPSESRTHLRELEGRIRDCYESAYGDELFVRLLSPGVWPDTKNVVGTNVIEIGWTVDPRTRRLIVVSAEDSLVKGAGGQAVQSFNILQGLPEQSGLI